MPACPQVVYDPQTNMTTIVRDPLYEADSAIENVINIVRCVHPPLLLLQNFYNACVPCAPVHRAGALEVSSTAARTQAH